MISPLAIPAFRRLVIYPIARKKGPPDSPLKGLVLLTRTFDVNKPLLLITNVSRWITGWRRTRILVRCWRECIHGIKWNEKDREGCWVGRRHQGTGRYGAQRKCISVDQVARWVKIFSQKADGRSDERVNHWWFRC